MRKPTRSSQEVPFIFAFVGGQRDWHALGDLPVPTGKLWELRAIPGNVVAVASTPSECVEKLQRHIDRSIIMSKSSLEHWYVKAWERATSADEMQFKETIGEAHMNRTPPSNVVSEISEEIKAFVGEFRGPQANLQSA